MWEEDPRYQDAQFRQVLIVVVTGTLALAALGWYVEDLAPLKMWALWFLGVEAAWLIVASAAYGLVRLWRFFAERRAKSSAPPGVP